MSKSRSGFVYAALHPTNPKWVKIGFTRFTPWSRLQSLSSTSVREPFTLHDARFMWDALDSERRAHQWLQDFGFVRQKEFFEIDKAEINHLFNVLEQHDRPILRKSAAPINPDQITDEFLDNLAHTYDDTDQRLMEENLVAWSTEDLSARWKYIQNDGVHHLEELAAQGDFAATFALAQYIAQQGVSVSNVRHCVTLAAAAEKQGLPCASLQGLQWDTLVSPDLLPLYWEQLWGWREKKMAGENLPAIVETVFEVEQHLSRQSSERSSSWSAWCAARPLKRSL